MTRPKTVDFCCRVAMFSASSRRHIENSVCVATRGSGDPTRAGFGEGERRAWRTPSCLSETCSRNSLG